MTTNTQQEEQVIEVKAKVSAKLVDSILVTAFDGQCGGSLFWADWAEKGLEKTIPEGATCDLDHLWTTVHIQFDPEDAPTKFMSAQYTEQIAAGGVPIGAEEIGVGLARFINDNGYRDEERQWALEAVVTGDGGMIDANLADCIVQEALFGKQVYA